MGRIREVSNGVVNTVAGGGVSLADNVPATSAQLSPRGIAVDSAGNLYIAENQRIRRVSNGVINTVAGGGLSSGDNVPATSVQIYPDTIALDQFGNIYETDQSRVRKITNGIITTIAGTGTFGYSGDGGPATSAALTLLGGIAVDPVGNVYLNDYNNGRVRVLTPSGGIGLCSASVSQSNFPLGASGGNLSITIQTAASCAWAVQNLPSWITYSGTAVRTGPATITLAVAANTGEARSALISIAGVSLAVQQAGVPGSLSLTALANAASSLSGGSIAPGEIVVLYGTGLGPAQLLQATVEGDGLYPKQLAGTTVSFNGLAAPIVYTLATQVAAIVPYGITGTAAQVAVSYQGQTTPLA